MEIREKLSTSVQGALAGGGDPATSPLYVFGPFLLLIVPAGVAQVTFGPSIWLVVLTVAAVSLLYRLVMRWVTDGTGGTGLSEEEFGPWAAKANASITFIEYTLTFLVSISALVTFLADRFPDLRGQVAGLEDSFVVALLLTVATGALVNRGPRVAALAFGPATAGVLVLLWVMMGSTVWRFGLRLPGFELRGFQDEFLTFTLGGYARILALMPGIEVFANLVAAYDGPPERRSRLAFRSLLIIMGSTAATMLIVGPAILSLSNPTDTETSVFTQTMDALLPTPLAYLGTLSGIAVLLSAGATALQGVAHLGHGLSHRHYVPQWLARPAAGCPGGVTVDVGGDRGDLRRAISRGRLALRGLDSAPLCVHDRGSIFARRALDPRRHTRPGDSLPLPRGQAAGLQLPTLSLAECRLRHYHPHPGRRRERT